MKKTLVFIFFAFFPLFYAGAASPIEINLKPGEKSEKLECAMTIGEAMPEGIYRAQAEVMDQNKTTVIKNEKEFIVSGTKKMFEADALLCADIECTERKVVFMQGEKVYIRLEGNSGDISVNAFVDDQSIVFDNNLAIFEATKEGSFALKINLEKQGFVNQEIDKDFAVIAAPAKIKSASVCQVDNKCTGKETEQNCPQDCVIVKSKIFSQGNIIFSIVLLVAVGFIVVGYKTTKKKQEQKPV